jgi:hypothetical protein
MLKQEDCSTACLVSGQCLFLGNTGASKNRRNGFGGKAHPQFPKACEAWPEHRLEERLYLVEPILIIRSINNVACKLLNISTMTSSFDTGSNNSASPSESAGAGHSPQPVQKSDPARHVSPVVAHELNNMLTIIKGYADSLLMLHGETPSLEAHLKHIAEAARRAATIIRGASPVREAGVPSRPQ